MKRRKAVRKKSFRQPVKDNLLTSLSARKPKTLVGAPVVRAEKPQTRARDLPSKKKKVISSVSWGHQPLGQSPLASDLVLVSLPTWEIDSKRLLRALNSILRGGHQNVAVVITSDGEKTPSWKQLPANITKDSRVHCFHHPSNEGPYFHHDVVMRAAYQAGAYFAVQDSDDESCTGRLTTQLRTLIEHNADACFSPVIHVGDQRQEVIYPNLVQDPIFRHRVDQFGLYKPESLLRLGGYHGGFRLGFDTLITSTVALLGRACTTPQALYKRYIRPDSLTRSQQTGHGSALRRQQKEALEGLWGRLIVAQRHRTQTAIDLHRTELVRGSQPYVGRRDKLVAEVVKKIEPSPSSQLHPSFDAVVRAASPTEWSISIPLARELYQYCCATKPRSVVDVGSGLSTFVLALYASQHNARVLSLEHQSVWAKKTYEGLKAVGLHKHVELRIVPLKDYGDWRWYACDLEKIFGNHPIDFMFVDGPPASEGGRDGAFFKAPQLFRNTTVWLHDGLRPEEQALVQRWKQLRSVQGHLSTHADNRGVWKLKVK